MLDLPHERVAVEKVGFQLGRELPGHDGELVVNHLGKRNGPANGNEMLAPLKHEAGVPEDEERKEGDRDDERGTRGAEEPAEAVEEEGEADDEERSHGNKKAIAIGRNARPNGIRSDEIIESDEDQQEGRTGTRDAAPEGDESDQGEKENGRPGKQAMIGGKKNGEKMRREPVPLGDVEVTRFEGAAIDDAAGDEGRQKANDEGTEERDMARE